ncbi:hypothetical protein K435DRAFT_788983 [Dendrothele bispora CBS 962.96]|uniref:Uncharacterized protein n=1 Tax=Dendrothele bispora (strain CBS 962.96) TaxID=1314807 RepID=A0A4S8MUF4_DENBC|nr:hypothetical protein K435DRAFT_788983 [Dendrothele bispora CBS 962.96]
MFYLRRLDQYSSMTGIQSVLNLRMPITPRRVPIIPTPNGVLYSQSASAQSSSDRKVRLDAPTVSASVGQKIRKKMSQPLSVTFGSESGESPVELPITDNKQMVKYDALIYGPEYVAPRGYWNNKFREQFINQDIGRPVLIFYDVTRGEL